MWARWKKGWLFGKKRELQEGALHTDRGRVFVVLGLPLEVLVVNFPAVADPRVDGLDEVELLRGGFNAEPVKGEVNEAVSKLQKIDVCGRELHGRTREKRMRRRHEDCSSCTSKLPQR